MKMPHGDMFTQLFDNMAIYYLLLSDYIYYLVGQTQVHVNLTMFLNKQCQGYFQYKITTSKEQMTISTALTLL